MINTSPPPGGLSPRRRSSIYFASALILCSAGYAQEDEGEETFELSPFVVDGSNDVGYAATETLGGTRLRTQIKDVGSSITTLTEEFLDDLGADTFSEAFEFTPSAGENEGDVTSTNSSMNVGIWDADRGIRIRGFGFNSGSNRDFFSTLTDGDRYNVERFTVSRGPNSMLFGIGGPGGATVAATKRAQAHREFTKIGASIDSFGSRRLTLDHNKVLIEDKLAVRFNTLFNEKDTDRRNEGKRSERLSAAITWQPLEGTKVTGLFEAGNREMNSFGKVLPIYMDYARWNAGGQPTFDFFSTTWLGNDTREGELNRYTDPDGNRVAVYPGVVDEDGLVDSRADFDPANALDLNFKQQYIYSGGDDSVDGVLRGVRFLAKPRGNQFASSSRLNLVDDPFGLPNNVVTHPASWDNPMQQIDYDWKQIFVEQKITEKLYLEYAYSNAKRDRLFTPEWSASQLRVDVNKYLSDGSENPYFLMPYNEVGLQINDEARENTSHRLTASYELDFTTKDGWTRWLGKHNLAGLLSQEESDDRVDVQRFQNIGEPRLNQGNILAGNNRVRVRNYFSPDGPQAIGAFDVLEMIPELQANQSNISHTADNAPIDIALVPAVATTPSHQETDAYSFAWQGRFLNGRLVTTAGYRKDHVKTFTGVASRTLQVPGVTYWPLREDGTEDPRNTNLSAFEYAGNLAIKDIPDVDAKGDNRTYSGVFHATDWMSFTYSQSSNFEVPGRIFPDISDPDAITAPSNGEGKDYGVRFYLFENKLTISANYFENSSDAPADSTFQVLNDTNNIHGRLRNFYRDGNNFVADIMGAEDPDLEDPSYKFAYFQDMPDELHSERDFLRDRTVTTTKGYELSATFNPNKNWRIYVSGSVNENKLDAQLAGAVAYHATNTKYTGFDTQLAYADELDKVLRGESSAVFAEYDPYLHIATDEDHELHEIFLNEVQTGRDNIRDWVAADALKLSDERALIGVQRNRNGKYNANGVVTYKFTEGRFKGLNVGTNFRYRSDPIAGYVRRLNDAGRPLSFWDVSQPIYGDGVFTMGMMFSYNFKHELGGSNVRSRIQLNVNNLLGDDDPRIVRVEHDTNGYFGEVDAIVPLQYQYVDPRSFKLSYNLDF